MNWVLRVTIAACLTVSLFACSSDTTTTPGDTNTGTADIGSAGGTVRSADGEVLVTIPAGALATTETISVMPLEPANYPAAFDGQDIESAYTLGPEGQQFAMPITLEFASDQTPRQPDGSVRVEMELLVTIDDQGNLEDLGDVVLLADGVDNKVTLTGTTDHFSPFGRSRIKSDGVSPISVVDVQSFQDGPETSVQGLLDRQFSTSTNIRTDFSGSRAQAPVFIRGFGVDQRSGVADFTVREYTGEDFAASNAILHQNVFECTPGNSGQSSSVGIRLDITMPASQLARIEVLVPATCPEEETGGGDEPIFIAGLSGAELVKTFQFPNHTWDNRATNELDFAVAAGGFGAGIYNLQTGAKEFTITDQAYYGALPLAAPGESVDFTSGFLLYGPGGAFHISHAEETGFDHFGQLLEFQTSVWDATAYNNDPVGGGAAFVTGTNIVKFQEFDENGNLQGQTPIYSNALSGSGSLRGALVMTSYSGAESAGDVLIVTHKNAANGNFFLADRANPEAIVSSSGFVGMDPRRARCLGNIVAVSNYESDDLTIINWTMSGAAVAVPSIPVGDGPVGIDLLGMDNGNVAIVSTGFNDHTWSLTVVDGLTGALVSNVKQTVPEGGQNPGHASWTEMNNRHWALISNYGSGTVVPVEVDLNGP